jgi:hypothetical protein
MILFISVAVLLVAAQQAVLAVRALMRGGFREALMPLGGAVLAGTQAALLFRAA